MTHTSSVHPDLNYLRLVSTPTRLMSLLWRTKRTLPTVPTTLKSSGFNTSFTFFLGRP